MPNPSEEVFFFTMIIILEIPLVLAIYLVATIVVADPVCNRDNVYRALLRQPSGIGDIFCSEYLLKTYFIGTLEPTITLPTYTTETNTNSNQPVTVYKSKGTRTKITTTNYASQTRTANPTKFTLPLPSYIEQYPTTKVSSACSCLITSIPTDTIYRRCDVLDTTKVVFETFTYTVGLPGKKTVTYSYTDTTTKYKATTAPFPTTCPEANAIDYVASDDSAWDRACDAYLPSFVPIDEVKAPSLDACIEMCVDYNRKEGYTQCQGVLWLPQNGNSCQRVNMPGYLGLGGDGVGQVATLRFYYPKQTESDYCATITYTGI